jgi:hypothetical protein
LLCGAVFWLASVYLQKFFMSMTAKQKGLYWLLFGASVIAFFGCLYSPLGAYCSMILPFNTTFLAKALDLM